MALSPFLQALLQPQDSVPYEGAAGPVDPIAQIIASLSDPGVASPLANPGGVPVSPEADARGRRERALADLLGSSVEPEEIGFFKKALGGIANAGSAYAAGLQGRGAPPSALEALRQRRLMAAERESQTKRQAAGLQYGAANADLQYARGRDAAREDREAGQEFVLGRDEAQREFTTAERKAAASDAERVRGEDREIADKQFRERMDLAWAELNKGTATEEQQRLVERDQNIMAPALDELDALIGEDGNPIKISDAKYQSLIKKHERRLRLFGVQPGTPEYRKYMTDYQRELDPHWTEPGSNRGRPIAAEEFYTPESGIAETAVGLAQTQMWPVIERLLLDPAWRPNFLNRDK